MESPLRWILIILGVFAVLLIAAQLFLSIFLDDIAGDYLKESVRKSTNGTYRIDYDDLDLGLLSGSVEMKNIHLRPDSSVYRQQADSLKKIPVLGEAKIKALDIDGISLWAYFFRNSLSIGSVLVDRPVLSVDGVRNRQSKSSQTFSSVDSSLYALISPRLSAFYLGEFEIRNGSFSLRESSSKEGIASVQELNLHLQNIHVDSASAQSGRLFVTDDIELNAAGYAMNLSQGYYTVRLSKFQLSSSGRKIRADSLQLIPRLPRYELSAKKGGETDHITLLINRIMITGFDFDRVIQSGRFYARALSVDSTELDVFRDKRWPSAPGRSPALPQLAFRQLPYSIKIDTIEIHNADISYTEHVKGVPKPGTVRFENIQAVIAALSNYENDLEKGHEVKVETTSEVMGKGVLNTYFTFFMSDPNGTHTIYGNMGSMKVSALNPVLENLAFIHADQGIINSMEFSMTLDKEDSHGSMILNYENLSLELLESETLEQDIGQEIKTFIANTFVIKESNTDPPLRKAEIKFERDRQKSVFNFWWKSLSTGLKNSIGL